MHGDWTPAAHRQLPADKPNTLDNIVKTCLRYECACVCVCTCLCMPCIDSFLLTSQTCRVAIHTYIHAYMPSSIVTTYLRCNHTHMHAYIHTHTYRQVHLQSHNPIKVLPPLSLANTHRGSQHTHTHAYIHIQTSAPAIS